MHPRIAIVIIPGPGTRSSSPVPDELSAFLPPRCFILNTSKMFEAGPQDDERRMSQTAPARLSGTHLRTAAQRARTHAATHFMVLRHKSSSIMPAIQNLVTACQAHPEALIIGYQPPMLRAGRRRGWRGEKIPRFWFKMQTGHHLTDPRCPLRIYPLTVIENLRLYQQGTLLNTEILVKSAWADVPLQEVQVDGDISLQSGESLSFLEPAWRFLLNIHYTLRSVLPVPHRKLLSQAGKAGSKISVWRPMRSLRTLLRENTSPPQLAIAAAMGVFFGTLPLIAVHSLIIILAANYFRLNKIASLSASQLCMPPIVPALCIETGYLMRHGEFLTEISLETLGYQALERLYEWLLGSLVLAPLLAILIGGTTLLMARFAARSMATVRKFKPNAR